MSTTRHATLLGPLGRPRHREVSLGLLLFCLSTSAFPLVAQQPDSLQIAPDSLAQATLPQRGVGPGGAFLRAALVPGWGHAAIGAHTRGGFYALAQSANGWMVFRTLQRLGDAKDVRGLRETEARRALEGAGVTDPQEVDQALDADTDVTGARDLVTARRQQFEDWLALAIFTVFLSGADAFVSAHLQNFPQPMDVGVGATPDRLELGVVIPLGGGG